MARSVRVVCYGINGGGVGHVTRLAAIARWMRRYALVAGFKPELFFLSSSDADSLLHAEGFPSFKVPSKTMAAQAGLEKTAFLGLAKQWIWHSIGLLRPDLFVVDTFPRGSFGELPACLDLCKKRGFIYRPVKPEVAGDPEFQSALTLYDAIIAPVSDATSLEVPSAARPRLFASGLTAIRERVELLPREAARGELGLAEGEIAIFASAGGGGDAGAAGDLDVALRAAETLRAEGHRVVVVLGLGPLSTRVHAFSPDVRLIRSPGLSRWLLAADIAISSAGYNSFAELALAEVPAIFVPQEKIADDQRGRARSAVQAGAARAVERPLDEARLLEALRPLLDEPARAAASAGWRALPRPDGARRAAARLLRLVLPASALDAAVTVVGDELLQTSRELGWPEELLTELAATFGGGAADTPLFAAEEAGRAALGFARGLEGAFEDPADAARLAGAFLRRFEEGAPQARADAAARVVHALARFGDPRGAMALLRQGPSVRARGFDEAARVIVRVTDGLARDGADLYRGIERLVREDAPAAEEAP